MVGLYRCARLDGLNKSKITVDLLLKKKKTSAMEVSPSSNKVQVVYIYIHMQRQLSTNSYSVCRVLDQFDKKKNRVGATI
jgi:hypothetical protein